MAAVFWSRAFHYVVPVLAVGLAVILTFLIEPLQRAPSTLFFAAVMASAWHGGLGPGLVATLLSTFNLAYFFLPPVYSFKIGLADSVGLGVFGLVAVMISSLNAARKRLEEILRKKDREKDRFLVMLAHQVSTPLAEMKKAMEKLRAWPAPGSPGQNEFQTLNQQIQNLAGLARDLTDVGLIGQGKLRLFKTTVDLTTIAKLAVAQTRRLFLENNQKLEVFLPPQAVLFHADPSRIEHVIVNLLLHAARFTDPGGRICLTVAEDLDQVLVRVQDTGIGFSSESLPHVLDLANLPGLGGDLRVGLSLVRKLVALHGGSITVASAGIHKGSEIVVRLPAAMGTAQQHHETALPAAGKLTLPLLDPIGK